MLKWSKANSYNDIPANGNFTSHRNCPVCEYNLNTEIFSFKGFQFFSDSNVDNKRVDITNVYCNRCWAIYLNPAYNLRGFEVLFAEAGRSYGSTEERPAEQISWLAKHDLIPNGATVLDVGCGNGAFLSKLPPTLNRIGVDIDFQSIISGNEKYKDIELINADFETLELNVSPNLITMFHVLEHLRDPYLTLVNLYRLSDYNTRLVIEVPLLENGFTNDLCGFLSVQHMTHFSKASFTNILNRAGWKVIKELEQDSYNGFRVIASPSSKNNNASGNESDLLIIKQYLKHWESAISSINCKLKTLESVERIVLWGAGLHTEFLYQLTGLFQDNKKFILTDIDPLKHNKTWRGIPIITPQSLENINWDHAMLVVSSYGSQYMIKNCAVGEGVPESNIVMLYDNLRIY
jgi:ubiquinone/menaquinone biosynthesis C-methylase UbiE